VSDLKGLGSVVCLGVHILDILGRPVTTIPPGQRSILIDEIRATAAGTAAGTSVDLAKLGIDVRNVGAIGDDILGDFVVRLLDDAGVDAASPPSRRRDVRDHLADPSQWRTSSAARARCQCHLQCDGPY